MGALIAATGATSAPALPVTRAAGATTGQKRALIPPGFELRSSNHYTIEVTALTPVIGAPGPSAYVQILVSGRTGSVSYLAPASATEESFEADLGELGRIAVAFHTTGGARNESSVCNKRQSVPVADGYYEGTIEFHGEEGYTEVEASRAKGNASLLLNIVCAAESESGSGPGLPGAELRVRGSRVSSTPSLTVVENDPRAPVQLEVNTGEQRGEIAIERGIRMTARRTAFDYDSKLRTATLQPPSPFSGTARFRRIGRRKSRWSGNLTVDLPGQSGVRLTGRHLRESLFRAHFKGPGPLE